MKKLFSFMLSVETYIPKTVMGGIADGEYKAIFY